MPSLPNYLRSQRKRRSLSQEEAAFLLGVQGIDRENKVSRHENFARMPTLETALAYEAMYGTPVRELFEGLYEQVSKNVSLRAKTLSYRKKEKPDPKKQQFLSDLALGSSKNLTA